MAFALELRSPVCIERRRTTVFSIWPFGPIEYVIRRDMDQRHVPHLTRLGYEGCPLCVEGVSLSRFRLGFVSQGVGRGVDDKIRFVAIYYTINGRPV